MASGLALRAARADNFYFPPGWDPKKGSLDKFHGSRGALGDRARKLGEGILIIRFEMPFNVWCNGCGKMIGKGVRFNAEKKQIGNYHSTKIWSFAMRAPCCQQRIVVHTDPKNAEYVLAEGAKRKTEGAGFKPEEAGMVELESAEERHARMADPLSRLEHEQADRMHAETTRRDVAALRADSEARHRNDYEMNKALRRQMRGVRKEEQASDARRRALNLPDHVKLLPETAGDALRASAVDFRCDQRFKQSWKKSRKAIAEEGIFGTAAVAAAHGHKRPSGSGSGGGASSQQQQQLARKRRQLDAAVKLRVSDPDPGKRQRL